MLTEITGISRVEKLYIQLLYRCNFSCLHCFHGERLKWRESFTQAEAERMIDVFQSLYGISNVTLLGGEPFLHRDITAIARFASDRGLEVEVCTNGYRVIPKLRETHSFIDKLRVSMEGLESTNDEIRHHGSYTEALKTLDEARSLGVRSAVTMTVNAMNLDEVVPLARILEEYGVIELKLHCLRNLGNAEENQHLVILDPGLYSRLHQAIDRARDSLQLAVLFDEDLDLQCQLRSSDSESDARELERVEVQPTGELYISCKQVGADSNAFFYDKSTGKVFYQPHQFDEVAMVAPQVRYSRV